MYRYSLFYYHLTGTNRICVIWVKMWVVVETYCFKATVPHLLVGGQRFFWCHHYKGLSSEKPTVSYHRVAEIKTNKHKNTWKETFVHLKQENWKNTNTNLSECLRSSPGSENIGLCLFILSLTSFANVKSDYPYFILLAKIFINHVLFGSQGAEWVFPQRVWTGPCV